ncbi:MAG TPA: hypothetical protein VH187_01515 [Scandinavium sp.]|jgi:hypothetical protein|uniref:hypothetical protein n=1 Tax=Scandinavium sp. TaxID=2830653 RepID=UPI002E318BF6|nr:hypothetical protein [Scandinavium sp.]HEX4499836.1 hypothetical protein [Scandinavium sp.]
MTLNEKQVLRQLVAQLAALKTEPQHSQLLNEARKLLRSKAIPNAAEMGRRGGSVRSSTKTATVRANGQKGGRPRQRATAAAPTVDQANEDRTK